MKVGDVVKIINYGHIIWEHKESPYKLPFPVIHESEMTYTKDSNAGIVGKTGTIREVTTSQGRPQYAIDGIPEKSAWYNQDQLELI